MYWKFGTSQIKSPVIPFYLSGTSKIITLTLVAEAAEDLVGCSLMMLYSDHAGLMNAKRAADSSYMAIGALNDASCFLGDFAAEAETDIDFQIAMPAGTADGLSVIPVVLTQNVDRENWPDDWSALWGEDWPTLWGEDWP